MDSSRYHLLVAVVAITFLLGGGTVLFHNLEHWSWIQSFYFSVVTLTTIGYGDFHPTSDISLIATSIYILVGVGTMLASITILATDRINSFAERVRNFADKKEKP